MIIYSTYVILNLISNKVFGWEYDETGKHVALKQL